MRHMIVALCAVLWAVAASGQNAIPDHRYVVTRDMDFFGADRTALFDTTFDACVRACSADSACVAFTFNDRSNACFPKSDITDRQPYAGARSATRIPLVPAFRAAAQQRADALNLPEDDFAAALALGTDMGLRFALSGETVDELLAASRAAWERGNRAEALRWIGSAVALTDAPDLWVRYAYIALRLDEGVSASQRRRARAEAVPAALNGYLRADTAGGQASALQTLAEALERNNRGRDMIDALRLAQSIQPRYDIDRALDEAIGKYGFRIVEHQVDNDSAAPRICATFSEPLVQAGIDYEPFVRTATPGLVVAADGRDLCIDGVSHGARYSVTFRSGLPAESGEVLAKDVSLDLYVRDRSPVVRFPGRGYVLPRGTGPSVPIETVNVNEVELVLSRVSDRNLVQSLRRDFFARPLSQWQMAEFTGDIAEEIWRGKGEVQNELNAEMRTRLPLDEALADQPPGVYVLSARERGRDPYDVAVATQWFVLSDLGLSTWQGNDGLTASVRALSDAAAVAGATVHLISQANAVLGTTQTDADGFAQFDAGLTRGRGSARPAMVQVETADDFVFLPLTDAAFDLSDRGVEGRPPAPPIDLFLTTDRGAYRPGATIHLTALARDARAQAITGLPLTVILSRPDGVEYSRSVSAQGQSGGHVVSLPLGLTVPRGTWRIEVKGDMNAPALATRTVLVEDFIPDRIDVTLATDDVPLSLRDPAFVDVDAQYLFGAPGANLVVEGDVQVQRRAGMAEHPGYRFGRHDAAFSPQRRYVQGGRTDAQGQFRLSLPWPDVVAEDVLLEAVATVRVSDSGGRPVERNLTRPIAPQGPVIGIKPGFEDVLPEGSTASFQAIAVGALNDVPVTWTVNRIETRYQWYQLYGNWNWEPVTRRIRVGQGTAVLGETPIDISTPTEWGDYELVIESTEGVYTATSVSFASGWYGATDGSDTPDRLGLSLDAERYSVGDTAQLRITPPHDGVALISVLSGHVISRQAVPVTAGETVIPLEVTEDWGTGAYVTASVLRSGDATGPNPARVLGLAHAAIDPAEKALSVSIDAPVETNGQPGTTEVSVQVDGLNGAAGYVTLAAVDVGILNLTGFEPPNPQDHYFGQRRLGVDLRDVYGRLIDGQSGALGAVRSGGDAGNAMQRQGPPPTEAVMAAFSGPVAVDASGQAQVTIPRPAFNGTIRLMAVAWSEQGVGQATTDIAARDPVVISAALPRFLAPGDQSRVQLEFVHAAGASGDMPLAVSATGLSIRSAPATVSLAEGGTVRVSLPLTADEVGDHQINVALTTPDGAVLRKGLILGVRSNDPTVATTQRLSLAVGEALTFDDNVFANLRRGSARATLAAGPLARFDMPGLLRQLDRYPYGCTEQITSAALPLLYVPRTAQAAGLTDIDTRIDSAIARVLTRQASNGAFGLWRAQSGDFWLDAYVTDFMLRAQDQGHDVPDRALRLALDNLRNRINYAPDFDQGGEDIAYALMVLARAGFASIGDLRYYADTKAEALSTPLARAQLGAALASYGEQTRADRLFGLAEALATRAGSESSRWRADYGTPLRDAAGLLHLAAEAGSTRVDQARLAASITANPSGYSTQEAAQVLMAAQALRSGAGAPVLSVDDTPISGPVVQNRAAGDAPSTIRNISGTAQDVTLTTYGVPAVAPEAGGYGYSISRSAFSMEGTPVDGPWRIGERRAIVLTITPFEEVGARLIVDDPLPAGIEIDNPRLIRSGDVSGLDWLEQVNTEHAEFRSDRFLAAVNHTGSNAFRLAYIARAVSPGNFHHPAALVEDMYRAEYRAVTDTGRMVVTE
ncbi:alpha-2-macroglobulin family protein [Tateyamaria sp. ANG-S1]|uniref:alpha-2-macroglobulin family protein n=1 Tax=Tateyamaria sp. ANG-S1 TaxID=1577905 RepID=UPI00057EC30D|nr:alpha-2-macroglobulin family protein [Tateyamaria sp. ANG-S1]KIC49601.1 PAN domain-containing protein [Tateyamaria sp. ANG-S1]